MAQAGKTRGKNGRKRKATVDQGLREQTAWDAQMRRVREGVVPGAEEGKELCPVCSQWSEGWAIEGGKRSWYHFGRAFNCTERVEHIDSGLPDVPGGVRLEARHADGDEVLPRGIGEALP